jgi:hypothetical protein
MDSCAVNLLNSLAQNVSLLNDITGLNSGNGTLILGTPCLPVSEIYMSSILHLGKDELFMLDHNDQLMMSLTKYGGLTGANVLFVNGNIDLTGNLLFNGAPMPAPAPSQWLNNGSNIYYASGNVGIGSSNSLYTLDVYGTGRINNPSVSPGATDFILSTSIPNSNQIYLASKKGVATTGVSDIMNTIGEVNVAANKQSLIRFHNGGAMSLSTNNDQQVMIMDINGQVGIGSTYTTTNINNRLSITTGTAESKIALYESAGDTANVTGFGVSGTCQLNYTSKGDHVFYANGRNNVGGTELMRMSGNSNVYVSGNLIIEEKIIGQTWSSVINTSNKNWTSVAISGDGKYQLACESTTDGLYLSTNYGISWATVDSPRFWQYAAISYDGKYQSATVSNGPIYRSEDYGVTWTAVATVPSLPWKNISMSADGVFQTAVATNNQIYVSSDNGVSWSTYGPVTTWIYVAVSATGKYQSAVATNGNIYISSNNGLNWTSIAITQSWRSIAMSADGKYQTAVAFGGKIYRSENNGETWTAVENNRSWQSVAVSGTGQYQTAVVYANYIYISSNYGIEWSPVIINPTVINQWTCVAMSANAEYQLVGELAGYVYLSVTIPNTLQATTLTASGPVTFTSPTFDVSNCTSNLFGGDTFISNLIIPSASNLYIGSSNLQSYIQSVGGTSNLWLQNDATNLYANIANVGIGITTPTSNLHVVGTSNLFGNTIMSNVSASTISASTISASTISASTISASTISASTLTGTLSSGPQTGITQVGTLSSLTVTGAVNSSTLSGTLTTAAQPYITSVGTLSSLTISGGISASTMSGVLTTATQSYITSVGTLSSLTVAGPLNASTISGTLSFGPQTGITQVGILSSLTVSGGVSAQTLSGTLSSGPQTGITQVGTLTGLTVSGTVNASTLSGTLTTATQPYITNLGTLSNLNVTGGVSASTISASTLSGTLSTGSQPNITSVGTLSNLTVSGTVNASTLSGTLTTASQPNITSVGTLSSLTVSSGNTTLNGNATMNNITRINANVIMGQNTIGQSWISVINDTTRRWNSTAISETGQYQTVTVNQGPIYRSIDYGVTWSTVDSNREWSGVAMSSSGQYQTAVESAFGAGRMYRSIDFGATWSVVSTTPINVKLDWYTVAISGDGVYQIAAVFGGRVYISSNFGANWTIISTAPMNVNRNWYSLAISNNGQYQTAVATGGQIYRSADYGATWTAVESTRNWTDVAMSSSGQYQIASAAIVAQIYRSIDYGATWSVVLNSVLSYGIAVSGTGQYQTVSANTLNLMYISSDYGTTWNSVSISPNVTRNWSSVAMSANGQYQLVTEFNGYLYQSVALMDTTIQAYSINAAGPVSLSSTFNVLNSTSNLSGGNTYISNLFISGQSVPASSAAAGQFGEIRIGIDTGTTYLYYYTGSAWVRSAFSAF